MSLRDRMYELTSIEEVNEFLEEFPTGAIFKAGTCHKTVDGFAVVEKALNSRPNINLGFIRVVEARPASNHIAEITAIVHQSPQFILFADGAPVYDVDNWDITSQVVEAALQKNLGAAPSAAMTTGE